MTVDQLRSLLAAGLPSGQFRLCPSRYVSTDAVRVDYDVDGRHGVLVFTLAGQGRVCRTCFCLETPAVEATDPGDTVRAAIAFAARHECQPWPG